MTQKARPVSRVRASERAQRLNDDVAEKLRKEGRTHDSFQNFALNLGLGTDNALSASTYGFNPITLVRTLLEWIHRGSWLGGVAVDVYADDMTRAGIVINSTLPPEDIEKVTAEAQSTDLWGGLNSAEKWSRLYGGCVLVILVDGQDPKTPLRLNTIKKGQVKGFLVLDRWQAEPSLEELVQDYGPDMGNPVYYRVTSDAPGLARQTIHYTRVLRLEGIQLPYWQRLGNNLWGLSVIERLYDRMIAFDSATTGAAQLVYKSFLRTLKLKGLRQAAVMGGDALVGVVAQVDFMRRYQGQEGISLIDGEDELTVDEHGSFSGIADALGQFGQQISGALQMPLTRIFGQSPSGFNSGDAETRMYYDGIKHNQERKYRRGLRTFYEALAISAGVPLPVGWNFEFRSLWELDDLQKADYGAKVGDAVDKAYGSGLISQKTAAMELRQASRISGIFTNITDEDIDSADEELPDPNEALPGMGAEVAEGALPTAETGEGPDAGEPSAGKGGVARDAVHDAFEESQHPRTPDGRFGKGGAIEKHHEARAAQHRENEEFRRDIASKAASKEDRTANEGYAEEHRVAHTLHSAAAAHARESNEAAYGEVLGKLKAHAESTAVEPERDVEPPAPRVVRLPNVNAPSTPVKGTKLTHQLDFNTAGIKPSNRKDQHIAIQTAYLGWKAAKEQNKPLSAALTRTGYKWMQPGNSLAHGQPYLTVTPDGHAYFFHSELAHDRARIFDFHGIPIHIETPKGALRTGINANGKAWSVVMPCDYGFIQGVGSNEGAFEEMDCFVGEDEASTGVYVIDQKDLRDGSFDEHKCMIGFPTFAAARDMYAKAYSDNGAARMLNMTLMSVQEFKAWLADRANWTKPCGVVS